MTQQSEPSIDAGDGDLPGLDLGRLTRYLDSACPGLLDGPLEASIIAGGKSNITYDVRGHTGRVVVRRPPLGHVLATAHDMAREYRVLSALGPTDVPVPATCALCEDVDVIGAPFYVMEKAAGTPYRTASQLEPLGPARTRSTCERMVDTLADLHEIDPGSVGLSDFGRTEGFLERQVRRWKRQLDGSRTRELAGADELHTLLEKRLPDHSAAAIVHGDFRLDNLLVDEHDRVVAVLDWEMATLGDPLTDVALLLVYQRLATLETDYAVSNVSTAPGYLRDDEVLARYADRSGRDLSDMGFYFGLGYFKLAAILEGIYYRYTHGQTVGEGFDTVGAAVEPLIAAGNDALRENP